MNWSNPATCVLFANCAKYTTNQAATLQCLTDNATDIEHLEWMAQRQGESAIKSIKMYKAEVRNNEDHIFQSIFSCAHSPRYLDCRNVCPIGPAIRNPQRAVHACLIKCLEI